MRAGRTNYTEPTERLVLLVPASLWQAVEAGAAKNLINTSAYIRQAVLERLEADGVSPTQQAA
jgi:hypothetical protein